MQKRVYSLLKGLHYRNRFAYSARTFMQLGSGHNCRFRLAAEYIRPGEHVLDLCAGVGELKKYLPDGCTYECIEKSPEFAAFLRKNNITNYELDLHKGFKLESTGPYALTMIISLYQFRHTSADELLEIFKNLAKKVIIVEDVLAKRRERGSMVNRLMNYLCATDYYLDSEIFTFTEFERLMHDHGYTCRTRSKRYAVGYWEKG